MDEKPEYPLGWLGDVLPKQEVLDSASGCLWQFLGFVLFAFVVSAFLRWVW